MEALHNQDTMNISTLHTHSTVYNFVSWLCSLNIIHSIDGPLYKIKIFVLELFYHECWAHGLTDIPMCNINR
jgi:uncharacterized protein YerC